MKLNREKFLAAVIAVSAAHSGCKLKSDSTAAQATPEQQAQQSQIEPKSSGRAAGSRKPGWGRQWIPRGRTRRPRRERLARRRPRPKEAQLYASPTKEPIATSPTKEAITTSPTKETIKTSPTKESSPKPPPAPTKRRWSRRSDRSRGYFFRGFP